MNRIDKRFSELKKRNETAFIPFITVGDPTLEGTEAIIIEFDKKGADVIELGFPFSDPIADGPVIQASYTRVLSNGITIGSIFDSIRNIRRSSEIPIVAMVSYSIVFKIGCEKFIKDAKDAGLDGATIPDLPIEEADDIFRAGEENDFRIICFAAPTTTAKRIEIVTSKAQGFLYYISVVGITGMRKSLPVDLSDKLNELKKKTNCPIAVGFGVSTFEQAEQIGKIADGVIVGSAIVKEIEKNMNKPVDELAHNVGEFTGKLVSGAKGTR